MSEPGTTRGRLRPRFIAALLLIVVFGLGLVTGLMLDRRMLHRHDGRRRGSLERIPPWFRTEADQRRFWNWTSARLRLTPEQRVAIDSLIARRARQLEMERRTVEPRMIEIMTVTRRQIDSLLTPEQRTRLEEMRHRRGPGERKP